MRKISLMLIAALLLGTGSINAENGLTGEPRNKLAARISKLLTPSIFFESFEGQTADIRFMVNREYEIVVLTVDADNEALEHTVKTILNYKKVDITIAEKGKIYSIPIRVGW